MTRIAIAAPALAAAAALALVAGPARAQQDFAEVEITTEPVAEGLYMLQGAGGNMGLSVGEDGAFLIDDQFAPLSDKIMAAIAEVTDKPVEFVLNTHHHGDHTGGNEPFGASGSHIVAHENVRARLAAAENPAPGSLPVITFSERATFHWNGEEIRVTHLPTAHTDGDAVVRFVGLNAVHAGDIFFAGLYPFIDVASGGSLDGVIAALQTIADDINDETRIIPGHGPLTDKASLMASIALLEDVRQRVQSLIDEGLSEDEAVAADPLSDLNEQWNWRFIDGERMVRSAYQSLSQKAAMTADEER